MRRSTMVFALASLCVPTAPIRAQDKADLAAIERSVAGQIAVGMLQGKIALVPRSQGVARSTDDRAALGAVIRAADIQEISLAEGHDCLQQRASCHLGQLDALVDIRVEPLAPGSVRARITITRNGSRDRTWSTGSTWLVVRDSSGWKAVRQIGKRIS